MAWWRRGGSDPAPPRGDTAGTAQAASSGAVQRSAWQDLPPLRPTLTPTPPIAPLDTFTNSLATSHNPSFLGALGHVVDPDGPGGQVSGLASPVVPQAENHHRELAVAARPTAGSVVQRVLAAPRLWFSDNTSEPAAAPSNIASAHILDPTPAADPAFAVSQEPSRPQFAADPPRRLPAATPTVARVVSYTSAPLPAERTVLPTAPAPAALTVSRHASADHDHDHGEPGDQDEPDPAVATVQNLQRLLVTSSAPLVDRTTASSAAATTDSTRRSASSNEPVKPDTPAIQRSAAGGVPVAFPAAPVGGGALPSAALPAPQTLPAIPPAQTPSESAVAQRSASAPHATGHAAAPGDAPAPLVVSRRPVGLGAPIGAGSDSLPVLQRVPAAVPIAAPSVVAGPTPSAPAEGAHLGQVSTLGLAGAGTESAGPSGDASHGIPRAASGGSPDLPDDTDRAPLVLPASVQRAVDRDEPPSAEAITDLTATHDHAVVESHPQPAGRTTDPEFHQQVAPLVGGDTADSVGAPTTSPPLLGTEVLGTKVMGTGGGSDFGGVPTPGARPAVTAGPMVQRNLADDVRDSGSTVEPVSGRTLPVAGSVQRLGVGAPIALPAPPAAGPSGDRVTVREMSLQRMFEPAAAAIASGAAYADGPGSVVFRPPAPPSVPVVNPGASTPLTVARSAAPRFGTTLGLGAPVQRFGIPGASSLLGGARDAVGGVTDSARSAATGYADSARSAAGGYADTARSTATGYADDAQQAVGGYVDQARAYADTARGTLGTYDDTAGGYLSSARGAAAGYAEQAGGYVDQARGLAGGAASTVGGYADSARSAAGGYLASAQHAAGGLADTAGGVADSVTGAVQNASSAAGGVAGGVADAASGAVGGLATDAAAVASGAGSAASGAVGAVTGAVGAAAGAAAGALPTDLDELARRLFDPLSARLRNELLLDRERAGMITDLRR